MYAIFFTKHLTQKRKVWNDGKLKVSGRRVALINDEGTEIESTYRSGALNFESGQEIRLDKHLVEIDAPLANENVENQEQSVVGATAANSIAPRRRQKLLAKKRNVQQARRPVVKRIRVVEDNQVVKRARTPSGVEEGEAKHSVNDLIALLQNAPVESVQDDVQPTSMRRRRRHRPLHSSSSSSPSPSFSKGGFDGWSLDRLVFPNEETCARLDNDGDYRILRIDDEFRTPLAYRTAFSKLLTEYLNLQLRTLAVDYRKMMRRLKLASCNSMLRQAPQCRHGATLLMTVRKSGANEGRQFYRCPARADSCYFKWADELPSPSSSSSSSSSTTTDWTQIHLNDDAEQCIRNAGFDIYGGCTLSVREPSSSSSSSSASKKRMFLRLPFRKRGSLAYGKGDLFVLSASAGFAGDGCLVESLWHGPSSKDNSMEVRNVSTGCNVAFAKRCARLYALQVPFNCLIDLSMLDNLSSLSAATLPILPALLRVASKGAAQSTSSRAAAERRRLTPLVRLRVASAARGDAMPWHRSKLSCAELAALERDVVERFRLNADQARVLRDCARWLSASDASADVHIECATDAPPVVMVHGVFGSGKSYLTVALIHFLSSALREVDGANGRRVPAAQILVSSATNTAVDRILELLIEANFEAFYRVGSVRKISKRVLAHVLYNDARDEQESKQILTAMLRDDLSLTRDERCAVRAELAELERGGTRANRLEKLCSVRVVGVTCASASQTVLADSRFPIVLLDESSQMVEPLSLLPMARFGCERLVCVGDPQQLPPTLPSYPASSSTAAAAGGSLDRPMFSRLQSLGYEPIMLRTQYRCHAQLGELSSRLFYGGSLLHAAPQRAPLVPDLEPHCFIDYRSDRSGAACVGPTPPAEHIDARTNSVCNRFEARIVSRLVCALLDNTPIEPSQIGVIVFYTAQAIAIADLLAKAPPSLGAALVQVSTVDAFQGAERDIIILSCVRTSQLGFIADPNRLNVALTRARRHLFIVGCSTTLIANPLYRRLIDFLDHRHRQCAHQFLTHCGSLIERLQLIQSVQ
jgi:AAA domain/DNA helicase ZGRF1-like, N-terminal domain/GRF zinc finger